MNDENRSPQESDTVMLETIVRDLTQATSEYNTVLAEVRVHKKRVLEHRAAIGVLRSRLVSMREAASLGQGTMEVGLALPNLRGGPRERRASGTSTRQAVRRTYLAALLISRRDSVKPIRADRRRRPWAAPSFRIG